MTSSVIGALRVNLGLNNAEFSKGIGRSTGRLTQFAAKVGKIAGGMAAAMKSAMVTMGVSAIGAANEISRLSQVSNTLPQQLQEWSAGARSVGIEQEKLSDILKDVNDRVGDFIQTGGGPMADFFEKIAPKVGVTADMFRRLSGADALQLYVDSLEKANLSQQEFTFYMEAMASDSTLLLPLLRDGGRAMKDYADRAQRMGAIMSGEMIASLKSGQVALSEMRLAIDGMKNTIGAQAVPAIKAMAAAVSAAAMFFHQHADTITDVLRTVAGTAAVVAAMFATRYAVAIGVSAVGAMVLAWRSSVALNLALGAQSLAAARAGAAVKLLTVAFHGLRSAIISTGIGALVVSAGYLVAKFAELVRAAGGFGEALTLLGDVAREVWGRIGAQMTVLHARAEAVWKGIQASAHEMFADILSGGVQFGNRYVGIFRGAYGAVKAIWGELPTAIGDLSYQAADAMIQAVSWMLTQMAKPIDSFLGGINKVREAVGAAPLDLIGEVKLPKLENPYQGQMKEAGAAAAEAFAEGFNTDTFAQPDGLLGGLRGTASELRAQGEAYREAAGMLSRAAAQPMPAWQRLKSLLWGTKEAVADIPPAAAAAGGSLDELGEKGAGGGQRAAAGMAKAKNSVEDLESAADRGADAIGGVFTGLLDRTKSLRQGIGSLIMEIAKMQMMRGFKGLLGAGGMFSGVGSLIGGLIGSNANGTNNWRGGLTYIHERGAEIVDLPKGTRIIPHDLSKRMVDEQGGGSPVQLLVEAVPNPYFDTRVTQISAAGDMRTAQAGRRALPGQIRDMQMRGLR